MMSPSMLGSEFREEWGKAARHLGQQEVGPGPST